MITKPKQFDLAFCSRGELGYITSQFPVPVCYGDGNYAMAWTGMHLSPGKIGQPWSSRNPEVLFSAGEAIKAKASNFVHGLTPCPALAKPEHRCGVQGFDQMQGDVCPACETKSADIGPQRVAPKCVAAINAESNQVREDFYDTALGEPFAPMESRQCGKLEALAKPYNRKPIHERHPAKIVQESTPGHDPHFYDSRTAGLPSIVDIWPEGNEAELVQGDFAALEFSAMEEMANSLDKNWPHGGILCNVDTGRPNYEQLGKLSELADSPRPTTQPELSLWKAARLAAHYGCGPARFEKFLNERAGCTPEDAKKIIARYHELFPHGAKALFDRAAEVNAREEAVAAAERGEQLQRAMSTGRPDVDGLYDGDAMDYTGD